MHESSSQTKVDAGEESDMSSVYDAPPKRKKSETSKGEEKEKKEKVSLPYYEGNELMIASEERC